MKTTTLIFIYAKQGIINSIFKGSCIQQVHVAVMWLSAGCPFEEAEMNAGLIPDDSHLNFPQLKRH